MKKMNKLQRVLQMQEGRRTQILLVDGRRLDIVVQPRLSTSELLNIVASHWHLKDPDKSYFGLAFRDEKNHIHWLQRDRRVLDHELPRKYMTSGATLILFHLVRFYVESVTQLNHLATMQLYFLQARSAILQGQLRLSDEDLCQLGALMVAVLNGDEVPLDDLNLRNQISAFISPKNGPKNENTDYKINNVTVQDVLNLHEELCGYSKGHALLSFLSCCERQLTYGMHFYNCKDKSGADWILGINSKGIFQFSKEDTLKPKKSFQWKLLENLYYRDKKFSIEVHDPKRITHTLSSFNLYEDAIREPHNDSDDLTSAVAHPTTQVSVSRRAFIPSNTHVQVFFCETSTLCKTVWAVAIAQHQFYLDRKTAIKTGQIPSHNRNLSELTEKLSSYLENCNTLNSPNKTINFMSNNGNSTSDLATSSISSQSLPSLMSVNSAEISDEDRLKKAQQLKDRKAEIEAELIVKLKMLQDTCVEEGNLTGVLPNEISLVLKKGETLPKIKRRVGTGFAIHSDVVSAKKNKASNLVELEAEISIQKSIILATNKLVQERNTNKSVKRKRQRQLNEHQKKLKEMEQRLQQLRVSSSKPDLATNENGSWPSPPLAPRNTFLGMFKSLPNTPRGSVPDLVNAENIVINNGNGLTTRIQQFENSESWNMERRPSAPAICPTARGTKFQQRNLGDLVRSRGKCDSEDSLNLDNPLTNCASQSSLPIYENIGYKSNSYQSSYRLRNYPTLISGTSSNSVGQLGLHHRTHSEHSLQSLASSENDIQPLPDYRLADKDVCDHNEGAYNVPRQRTSWNYQSIDRGLNMTSPPGGPVYPQLPPSGRNIRRKPSATPPTVLSPKHVMGHFTNSTPSALTNNNAQYYTGSLDRRFVCHRNKIRRNNFDMNERRPPTQPSPMADRSSPQITRRVSQNANSPEYYYPTIVSNERVSFVNNSVEVTKPLETADLAKYSIKARRDSPASNSSRPMSPLVQSNGSSPLRPPPPPYMFNRQTSPKHIANRTHTTSASEMLAWFDEDKNPLQTKPATFV